MKIESIFVGLGTILIIAFGAGAVIETVALATDCNNGCSTVGVQCTGTNNATCVDASGVTYNCGNGPASNQWSGATTYGSTGAGGSTKVSMETVLCNTKQQCKQAASSTPGMNCKAYYHNFFVQHYSCTTAAATDECYYTSAGSTDQMINNTCLPKPCGEG